MAEAEDHEDAATAEDESVTEAGDHEQGAETGEAAPAADATKGKAVFAAQGCGSVTPSPPPKRPARSDRT